MTVQLVLSEHAVSRMRERAVYMDDIHMVLAHPDSVRRDTYDGRQVIYNWEYGIRLVVDIVAGVIVTVTETEERRECYQGRRLLQKQGVYGINQPMHRPPPSTAY